MLRAARRDPQIILTKFFLPYLQQNYQDSLEVMRDAQLVLTNSVAFGSKLAAETLALPHIGVVLQPYTLLSAFDPPLISNAELLSKLAYRLGPASTRAALQIGRWISARWAAPIHQFRRQIGLPETDAHPFFEGQFTGARAVGLYSRLLGDIQPDFPPHFVLAGFAFYDGPAQGTELNAQLERFLENADPPLVFTRGTSAVYDSDRFAHVAIEAVQQLQQRAILVLDDDQRLALQSRLPRDILVTGYLPYSTVFRRAKAIVHHGGIGTTAQALRSGRPQLIAPYFVDQPDNAARVRRLGVARVIDHGAWTTSRAARELRALLNDAELGMRAQAVAREISQERAVETVATLAAELLGLPLFKAAARSLH
jgi:UDP:flavonoid glycosyltransferase YjiC (YdhE family)